MRGKGGYLRTGIGRIMMELTGCVAPVGGVMVTISLLAVAMTTVFGADYVCFLECRTGRGRERGERVVSEMEGGRDMVAWK